MVNVTRTDFASHQNPRRKEFQNEHLKQSGESSTVSALVSLQKPGKKDCIFCDKSHPSERCLFAKKITLTAKQKLLLEKGACFSCLKIAGRESVDGKLGEEESNSNNVTDNENNVTSADAVIVRKFTSFGRPVKAPTRLDLLNNVCYTLETLSESQGGRRMLRNEVK
ncbi:DUF1758 domain-containing protein [Nephila pilipes]|uniref:DUF1758 domain-containing protein n=1 Tax=Nephila pilipes TaxID=299642 RepID=A0A8X6UKW6_NEPPI|nr:DUF1758 domain-containing protein [Nephila pilipes]